MAGSLVSRDQVAVRFCAMSDDWRMDRIGSAQRAENPTVLRHLDAGFAVIGDTQFLPGYCVREPDERNSAGRND